MSRGAASEKHEKFDIDDTLPSARKKIVRQDRVEVEDENCWIEVNDQNQRQKHKLLNFSAFGLAARFEQELPADHEIRSVRLYFDGFEIAEVHLKVVRSDASAETGFDVAFEVCGEPISVDRIEAVRLARVAISEQAQAGVEYKHVPAAFKHYVFEAKDWLDQFQTRINQMSTDLSHNSSMEVRAFEDTVSQVIGDYLGTYFAPVFKELSDTMKNFTPEQTKESIEFFRNRLKQFIYQAPFADRSYSKPLGYAGDYEMMNIIYRNEAAGETLFAKCLHRYFVSEPAARAVRNRADYLAGKIREVFQATKDNTEPLKFLSVASGPAFEVETFMRTGGDFKDRKAIFYLLDQDESSLKYAQRRLERIRRELGFNCEIHLINQAIKNVIVKGITESDYDMVYSAGLFDYFSDPVAMMAGQKLMNAVKSGGQMIVGNFDISNPTRFLMELVLDWQLLYRSEDDMKRLFGHLPGDLTIEREGLGINLFCVARKS